ncbi:bifunctional alcohol dehydrogenase [Lipomyces japonicus]|uniref:bifunctional alcohol dehydrogenase n=1 Tax=Lipomyces japonicus TaxID=56871 RepID=UPI0034CEFC0A
MKALIYDGPGKQVWKDVPKPVVQKPTDAVVKLTATTICGTDLHIVRGHVPYIPAGRILGHEGVGIIDDAGSGVTGFKKGDRVVVSCITACGTCVYCARNLQAHCLHGGWKLGNEIDGTQAEYVRVPYADTSLYSAPSTLAEGALLMLSDALPTGLEVGVLNAKVQPGETVAIVGAGPIGISVLLTAQFYSPSLLIVIDTDDSRLDVAKRLGATHTINPSKLASATTSILDAVTKIQADFAKSTGAVISENQKLKPGVDVAIECVGFADSFNTCQSIISPGGRIANVGVHGASVDLQLQELWTKNISITTGLVSANTTELLLRVLLGGKLHPESLITHRFAFSDLLKAYKIFGNAAKEHALKTLITFK